MHMQLDKQQLLTFTGIKPAWDVLPKMEPKHAGGKDVPTTSDFSIVINASRALLKAIRVLARPWNSIIVPFLRNNLIYHCGKLIIVCGCKGSACWLVIITVMVRNPHNCGDIALIRSLDNPRKRNMKKSLNLGWTKLVSRMIDQRVLIMEVHYIQSDFD